MTKIYTPWILAPDGFINTEHAIQAAFICWARKARLIGFELASFETSYYKHPTDDQRKPVNALDVLFAVPNGGSRNKAEANRLSLEGVLAGVCDVILPIPGSLGYILALEFKAPNKPTNTSSAQKRFIACIEEHGGTATVVTSWREACWYVLRHLIDDKIDIVPLVPK